MAEPTVSTISVVLSALSTLPSCLSLSCAPQPHASYLPFSPSKVHRCCNHVSSVAIGGRCNSFACFVAIWCVKRTASETKARRIPGERCGFRFPPVPEPQTSCHVPCASASPSLSLPFEQKTATAVAYCKRGRGLIKVNGCPIELLEPAILRVKTFEPVLLLGPARFSNVDIRVRVRGGGYTSQVREIISLV